MKAFLSRNHRFLFYFFWLALGILQASLTELQDDEAYYWVCSKFPAWGYFDHPPLTAILIKWGYAIFPNELGVRLFPLLLNFLTLILIEKLLPKKNPLLFYTIALSLAVFQLTGFMAVPDTPLLFFAALFFFCYRNFLERSSWGRALWLGLATVLLFYTKYHAVLIVFFVFLSYPAILKKKQVWLAVTVALGLYIPHLLWQEQHGWGSFRYHLLESNVDPYRFSFTAGYIGSQFLLAGPVAGIILLPAAFLYRSTSILERSLKWNLVGIYSFFLFSSFRGEVEMNWTSPAIIPLFILSHQYLNQRQRLFHLLFRLLPVSLMLIALARVVMISDILPIEAIRKRFHAWKEWPAEMKKRTNGLPVVFSNSYQRASKYWFYSGQMTLSQNHIMDHSNNFDLFPLESQLLGQPVYFMDIYDLGRFHDSLKTPVGTIGYRYDSSFAAYAGIKFIPDKKSYSLIKNKLLQVEATVVIDPAYSRFLDKYPAIAASIKLCFFQKKKMVREILLPFGLKDIEDGKCLVNIDPELPAGNYHFEYSIETPGYNPTHNSDKIKLRIKEGVVR